MVATFILYAVVIVLIGLMLLGLVCAILFPVALLVVKDWPQVLFCRSENKSAALAP